MYCKPICALIVLWQYVDAVLLVGPLVDSKLGLIRGQAATDGDYDMFLGIPYAKVDDTNPFGLSAPYPAFEDIFEAFNDSVMCPQVSDFDNTKIVGTLDCLRLNVYVPIAASFINQLPVLVWFHGGQFASGFSGRFVFGPKFLVRHDVILVTLNYRLGPYGFMCLKTPVAPGNQGLKDQKIALKWIKDNIAAFGGDASKITIFGESAGAAAVDFHVHLKQEDLFNQAILQSGSILFPIVYKEASNEAALKLSEHLGFVTSDVYDALSFLASVDSSYIIASSRELGLTFAPCVEDNFDDVVPFLTDYPFNLKARKMPLLIGFNNDECLISYNDLNADYFAEHDFFRESINDDFNVDKQTCDEMSLVLKNFYFGSKAISEDTKRKFLDFCLDFRFVYPALRSLRKFFDSGAQDIYLYMFSYVGQRNYIKNLKNITYGGASHVDDLSYLFDVSFLKTIMTDEDQIIIDRITALWTNFAKYGDPTPAASELLPVSWLPATRDQWNYLNIDSELTMETRPFHDRIDFLDMFYKMYEKYQNGYNAPNSVCLEFNLLRLLRVIYC